MNFGISTQVYGRQQLSTDLLETLRSAGYAHIELFCNRPHLDFHNRSLQRNIATWFQDNVMPPPSLHLPFLERTDAGEKIWISLLDADKKRRVSAMDEMKCALELADRLNVSHVVLHLGVPGEEFSFIHFDNAYRAIEQIRSFAGVRILIENIPNEISTVDRIHDFFDVSQLSDLGICYDTGHGHLQGTTKRFDRVVATHLHDNRGEKDEHLWPFDGTVNWPGLVEKLVVAGYTGNFLFEARDSELQKGAGVRRRLGDLWAEARDSIEDFRKKYKLVSEG